MNRKQNKGAIELSANFIVIIIISIVILAAGLGLFFKIKANAQSYVDTLDGQTQDKLKSMMLSNNYRVAVYPGDIDLGSGDAQLVGVGITNIYDSRTNFTVNIDNTNGVKYYSTPTSSGINPAPRYTDVKTFYSISGYSVDVDPKSQVTKGILIRMPDTHKGQYVYTVRISSNATASAPANSNYGTVQVYVYNN